MWACLAAGVLGYFMNRYDYPVAPTALAFILGGMLETNLRRGLVMTQGWEGFLSRPIAAVMLVLAVFAFVIGIVMNRRIARAAAAEQEASEASVSSRSGDGADTTSTT